MRGVHPDRLAVFVAEQRVAYADRRPRSRALAAAGSNGYYAGVPMHWMLDWPLPFPLVVGDAHGSTLFDVDGVEIKCRLDFGAKAIDWRGLYKNAGA